MNKISMNNFIAAHPQTFKASTGNPSDIELVTQRKEKPDFNINQELANRTFIRPLPPKGHLVKGSILRAPMDFFQNIKL